MFSTYFFSFIGSNVYKNLLFSNCLYFLGKHFSIVTWDFQNSHRAQPLHSNLLYHLPPYLLTVIISRWCVFPLHSHSIFIRALLFSVITLASIKSLLFSGALIFSQLGLTDQFPSFFTSFSASFHMWICEQFLHKLYQLPLSLFSEMLFSAP